MDDKEDLDSLTINLEEFFDNNYLHTLANTSITIDNPNIADGGYIDPYWTSRHSNDQLNLVGEDADININGMSLKTAITEIQQRLNILQPNTKLEAEWDQLRELGEQYRKLEANIIEKQKIWNNLKQ